MFMLCNISHIYNNYVAHPNVKPLKRGQKNLTRPVASSYSTSDVAIRVFVTIIVLVHVISIY